MERAAGAAAEAEKKGAAPEPKQRCLVCENAFVPGDEVLRLECLHEYHRNCISSVLVGAGNPACPSCGHPVVIF